MKRRPRFLITAGPTREMIDPVRFLSNVSTGTMGYELARAVRARGFKTSLISGPTALKPPRGVRFEPVVTGQDMKRAMTKQWPRVDVLVMTAAVCDYQPVRYSRSKIKRVKQKSIKFKRTGDILESFGRRKGKRILIGFSLETDHFIENARRKLKLKKLDLVVLNWYQKGHDPFGSNPTSMILLDRWGSKIHLGHMSKAQAARAIVTEIEIILRQTRS
jgi:phosphopantothenoylcysteine decarboxylase / phosphopantothenate---cysteine ligase